ncbi:hypothetical protein BGZ61DRAFT_487982 [Ilyonectria robusta]|uniref:uncharacterized protein n=1 Tax=Ilyonectria robusta TaxID=1079257 RepID=UPI001E8DAB6B|nr:uncharacterized protein BGZ61DRAFT_487982 [Ilyonectria robusta]KAH8649528.1 hypothetical protein BGZ61DRAFT_487982 [Ilyonectria robusta]
MAQLPDQHTRTNEQPPDYIRYHVEWKLSVNNRQKSGESEPGVVISPRKFWKHVLRSKLQAAVEKSPKPWEPAETKIILSVTDRKTSSITKRFPKLDIQWSYVAEQLQDWSHFLRDGKKLSAQVTFYYVEESGKVAATGRGATATKLIESNARRDAEAAVVGRTDSWRRVMALVRCPGPPCNKGPYCWQDGTKHYKLLSHHLKILVDETQKGCNMQTHNDIPERIRTELYAEEQQEGERARKRTRQDPGSSPVGLPVIHIHNAPGDGRISKAGPNDPPTPDMIFPTSPTFHVQGSREDMVKSYVMWQQSQVSSQEQKSSCSLAQDLTLNEGLSLEMVYCNQKRFFRFYKEHGVLKGVAWHFVCDIKFFQGSLKMDNLNDDSEWT